MEKEKISKTYKPFLIVLVILLSISFGAYFYSQPNVNLSEAKANTKLAGLFAIIVLGLLIEGISKFTKKKNNKNHIHNKKKRK